MIVRFVAFGRFFYSLMTNSNDINVLSFKFVSMSDCKTMPLIVLFYIQSISFLVIKNSESCLN